MRVAKSLWPSLGLALVAAVLYAVVAVPVLTSAAAPPAASHNGGGADAASAKYAPPPLPAFEKLFAQQFHVSVMTQSYGVFNATLRMHSSMNFPERVFGELIPIGEPRLSHRTQTPLPHFKRARGVEDDKLSSLPFTVSDKQSTSKTASGEFTTAGEEERPSLFVVDLQLLHSDSTRGKAQVYYLPAELMALRSQKEAMSNGSAAPTAMTDFTFRMEARHMSGNPLSDVAVLARVSAATVVTGSKQVMETVSEARDAAAFAAASKGSVIFRWITEHEFSAVFSIPMKSEPNKDGVAATHLEHMWIYGYTTPSQTVFDRKQRQVPWYQKYVMLSVGLIGFVMQIISGWSEGRTKAADLEKQQKRQQPQQAKLDDGLKKSERLSKKKK
ncbi:hypothetical protein ABL78_0444 [Leptomonas seymouri]|uniref:Uncharacterized protein n=1 Tax=Leptomonas seymouri TaxID=5684 RepID=A0A0N1IMH7_LEPSE|nr:hypothetical protein ABL78_0444 [Leptomonas seymouri]|eukprot:KPI90368.1 hypothetical protein ABL78_0444 [Leptomonas seymouri]